MTLALALNGSLWDSDLNRCQEEGGEQGRLSPSRPPYSAPTSHIGTNRLPVCDSLKYLKSEELFSLQLRQKE